MNTDISNQDSDTDPLREVELLLQRGPTRDPSLAEPLALHGYPFIYRLAYTIMPDLQPATALARKALFKAVSGMERYPVGMGIRIWLARITIRTCRSARRQAAFRRLPFPGDHDPESAKIARFQPDPAASEPLRSGVDLLAEPQRIIFLLRFLFHFSVAEIEQILGGRRGQVRRRLDAACLYLEKHLAASDSRLPAQPGRSLRSDSDLHQQVRQALQDPLNHRYVSEVSVHLKSCAACQRHLATLEQIQAQIATQWNWPDVPEQELREVLSAVRAQLRRPPWPGSRSGQEIGWTILAVGVVLIVGWQINRLAPGASLELSNPGAPVVAIPTAIEVDRRLPTPDSNPESVAAGRIEPPKYSWGPVLSRTGHWLAFSSTVPGLVAADTNEVADVFILEIRTREIRRVSQSSAGEQANGDSFATAISGDGRLIVFFSFATNLTPETDPACAPADHQFECLNIFVHDRITGSTELVPLPPDRGRRRLVAPTISADGRWLAVISLPWDDTVRSCNQDLTGGGCLEIGFFDRTKEAWSWKAIKAYSRSDPSPISTIDLSADGSLAAFTLLDRHAWLNLPEGEERRELLLYDRMADLLRPVSLSEDGRPGNGPVYTFDLSADGRWIAFASAADNLVPGDRNDKIDVFIRDLATGT